MREVPRRRREGRRGARGQDCPRASTVAVMTSIGGSLLRDRSGCWAGVRCRFARPTGRRWAPRDSSTDRGSWPPRAHGSVSGSFADANTTREVGVRATLPRLRRTRHPPGYRVPVRTPTHAQARPRRLGTALAAAVMAAALLVAAPAAAVPTCAFDGPTATVTVAVGNGETATIARTGEAITLDAVPCGAATVSTP